MMWRKGLLSVIAALFASTPVLAQTGSITGQVTSVEGARPLSRVSVTVLGAGAGALTREDGRYTVSVRPGSYTVRAARIGYAPDTVRVVVTDGGTATADFQLKAAAAQLSGIVVIGYGTEQARDKTGSIATVTQKEFNTGRVVSPEQLIEAKVPGVQVVDNNEPGGFVSLRIRGGTSVNASNEPLYVVDGVPVPVGGGVSAGRGPLDFLNPNDIENITVLKDASATAIYGSRGANGVVMITTKSGTSGLDFTYTGSASRSVVSREPDMMSADQYRAAIQQYAPANVQQMVGNANTNWRDAVERAGIGQDHNLAFSGRRQSMHYRTSLGYLDQQGVVQGTDVKRLSTALSYSDLLLNDRLNLEANVKGSRTDDWFTPGGVIGNATAFAPTQPIKTASGSYYQYTDWRGPDNPIAELAQIQDRGRTYRSLGNLQAKYRLPFLDGLTATVNGAYDVGQSQRTQFYPSTEESQVEGGYGGTISQNTPTQTNTVLDAYGDYAKPLAFLNSNVDVTAGYSYEHLLYNTSGFYSQGLSSDLLGLNGVPAATTVQNSIFVDESKLVSFFGRANYSIRDKYLFTLSVRRDGSSRFGPEHQWGVFPAAAFAWRIIDESFMKRFSSLSDLKLRLSYGVNGNQAFQNYAAYSAYTIGDTKTQVQMGNGFVTTIRPSAVDPGIRWEQTTSNDVGLDYGFFGNRITGTADYYFKKTSDLIFRVPVAAGTNLSNFVTTNIGSLQNKGFELGLNARVIDGGRRGFTWDADFNASTNSNKLLRINPFGNGTERILVGGISGGVGSSIQVLQPGQPINSFFVYRHRTDASGQAVGGDKPDTALYVDQNKDGIINTSDLVPYKNPAPKWILGHTSMMSYGNADLSFTVRAYLGNYVYNNVASNFGNYNAISTTTFNNLDRSVLKYGFVRPQYFSDVYVENASFLRLDNLSAGYTLRNIPQAKQVRLFGTIQNVFTTTKYSGVDPTAGVNGIDNNLYPRSRTFVAGANIAF